MKRLQRHLHVMRIGVNHQHTVDHETNVTFPEDEIATRKPFEIVIDRNAFAEFRLLHIGVARRDDARGEQRRLDEARAIEAYVRSSAPKIWRADESLGNLDEIARVASCDRRVPRVNVSSTLKFQKAFIPAADGQ